MKITGENPLPFPVAQVWDALLDPAVLVRTIPGCERLESTGEHSYAMTVTAGVAAIRGTYAGSCVLSELVPHESLVMSVQGAGAPGTVAATVNVGFDESDGSTRVTWDADAVVGGMVGGVGQRMLGSVSKRMAGEFFDNVGAALSAEPSRVTTPASAEPSRVTEGEVYTAPLRPGLLGSGSDFARGVAVGAGLVLLGVVLGRRL